MNRSPRRLRVSFLVIGLLIATGSVVALNVVPRVVLGPLAILPFTIYGFCLFLAAFEARRLTLAALVIAATFGTIAAAWAGMGLKRWITAYYRLSQEPKELATEIAAYESYAARCGACDPTELTSKVLEAHRVSDQLSESYDRSIRSGREAFVWCAPYAALFYCTSWLFLTWYRKSRPGGTSDWSPNPSLQRTPPG